MMIRLMAVALWAMALPCAAQVFAVPAELWDRPRSAAAILQQAEIRRAVDAHAAQSGSRLVIHHAAGQEAQLHAEELRAWLIALAVDPGHIALNAGLKSGENLRIEVKP